MKHSLARRTQRLFPALLAAGLLATMAPTFAQPGGGPGMNDNPPNRDGGGGQNGNGGGRGGNRGGQNGNRGDRSQMQAQMITRSLQRAGYTDQGLIEAVTTYMTNRTTARKPLYDAANALSQALTDQNTTDAQMSQLWDDFQSALEAEKTRTAKAEAELDEQIGYSKDAKLAASLTLLGVIGDATSYLGTGQGGRGGMGGGRGGGMGGGPGGDMGGGPGGGPDDMNG